MTCSRPLAVAAALALALACAKELPGASPRVDAVEPAAGYAARELPIVIRGEGFRPVPYQSGAGTPAVDTTFRAWLDATELAAVEWVSERELRARVPAGIPAGLHRLEVRDPRGAVAALDAAYAAVAGTPPALAVTAEVAPSVASLGQPVTIRVDVTNDGDLSALAVAPSVAIRGGALALSGEPPLPRDVEPGRTRTFYVAGTAAVLGVAEVTAGAAGTDAVTGLPAIAAEVPAGSLLVQPASILSASAEARPPRASVGQTVLVDVTYANAAGAAGVLGLRPEVSAAVGGGEVSIVAEPPPCDLPAGGTCVATFALRAEVAGTVVVHLDAAGTDANSGDPVAAPRATAVLTIDGGPRLSAAVVASPGRASVGQPLGVVVTVTNGGDVAALGVGIAVLAAPLAAEANAAPPPQDVPPGETRTFTWTFAPREAGVGAFVVEARGADANGAGPVASERAVSNEILVEEPAFVVATADVVPLVASAGQPLALVLRVTNVGGAAADATPALDGATSGSADFEVVDPPPAPRRITGGATEIFTWTVATSGSGTLTLAPRVDATDANSGAPVAASASAGPVRVEAPARLAAAISAPAVVNAGQAFTAVVTVTNAGEAAAAGVSTALAAPAAALVGDPTPAAPLEVAGGASAAVAWSVEAGAEPGTIRLDATAAGEDANAATPLSAAAAPAVVTVQRPAALSVELVAAPARVNAGQGFTARVGVSNGGDASAAGVQVEIACDGCGAGPAPAPVDVPGGAAAEVERALVAGPVGATVFRASAAGTDATDGLPRAAPEVSAPLSVEHPAALSAAFAPPPVAPTVGFAVVLEVTNPRVDPADGQADALGVAAGALAVVHVDDPEFLVASEVSCAAVDVGPADLAAGAATAFRWTCSAARPGQVKLRAAVAGLDGNDPSAPPPAASAEAVYAVDEAAEVAADPFGDGTPFSFVFAYDGHVFLGPSGDGRGLVRCAPDGSGCASFAFTFEKDVTPYGSVHPNACAQYVTLGSSAPVASPAGCDPSDSDGLLPDKRCNCGPDYEAGRGLLSSFEIAGEEWLVAIGRSSSEVRYLYMTRETASPLRWSYVDLTEALPSSTYGGKGVTSMAVLNDRLFVGLQADTGERPRLLALERTPLAPGLDARVPADASGVALRSTVLFETGSAVSQVDAMLAFEGRLFAANRRGVIVSTSGAPDLGADPAAQFADCTPKAPATWLSESIDPVGGIDVTPADKAVSALVAWQGRMFLARNTRAGPELWRFTPRRDPGTGAFLGCATDRSDWRLVVGRLGAATRTRATALFASDRHLYYGMDDATAGAALFRTASGAPQGDADFTGRLGCVAPCAPLGGAGFGLPTNTRFFDARALTFGAADQVWATVGDGASGVRVYRIAEE